MPTPDYRLLFDVARDGLVVFDASLTLVEANDAFAALLGVPKETLAGRGMLELIDPDDLGANPIRTAEAERDGATMSMRRLRRADGTPVLTEIAATHLPDGGMLCAVRVARQRDETAVLRDTEARFRAVAENVNAGLIVTDLQNRAVYVNGHMCAMTGYSAAELVGRNPAALLLSERDRTLDALRLRRRLAGASEVYDAEHRRKDGTTFVGEISAAPLQDGAGRLVGTVGVVVDVTDRYELEREMAAREQRYRLLFEVMPFPAWVYDVETFRFLAVNPAAVAHYGYSESELLTKTIFDIRAPEETEALRARLRELQDDGGQTVRGHPSRHRKKDGTRIDVEITSHPLEFEGRAARMVVVNDVTEQLRVRALEREMAAHLVQVQKMEAVGRLAGGVAHDFNNLLSVVLNAAGALEMELPADSPLRDDVGDIRQAVERGAALTRRLLAFGRKEVRAPALLDVNEVVTNVERLLARALGGTSRLEVARSAAPACTVADASQLEQVLVNLVFNARDAMPHGGTVSIATGVRKLDAAEAGALDVAEGWYVTLEVADTGTGMDETTRVHAFEPFFTTKGPHEGTGLGLATVYGIIRQSAGAVTLASTVGVGTRVTIYLPRGGNRSSPAQGLTRGEVDRAAEDLPRDVGCVLLVEDEPRVRAQARRILERSGYRVLDAADGAEGERLFREHAGAVDVVVTDVVMPVLGGVEMVARLRAAAPAIPVVFVSGYTAEDRSLPLDVRTRFVAKPYTVAALRDAVAAALAG